MDEPHRMRDLWAQEAGGKDCWVTGVAGTGAGSTVCPEPEGGGYGWAGAGQSAEHGRGSREAWSWGRVPGPADRTLPNFLCPFPY